MRHAWLLLLLTGCHRDENPEYIQSLLAQTPIPVSRLREIFEIKPGELELVGGAPPILLAYPAPPRWALRNRGDRALWIKRCELTLHMGVTPLLPYYQGGCGGFHRGAPVPRPSFPTSDWILLAPGERIPLLLPEPYDWGRVRLYASGGAYGMYLAREADTFNGGPSALRLEDLKAPLQVALGETWYLPPFGSLAGGLDVLVAADGTFTFEREFPATRDRPGAVELKAFVADASGELVFEGPMEVEHHEEIRVHPGALRVFSRYRIPARLPPGSYRALICAPDVGKYVTDNPWPSGRGDLTRWLPFSVGASSGSPGGAAPRD